MAYRSRPITISPYQRSGCLPGATVFMGLMALAAIAGVVLGAW
jgi:hypothetical protein